MMTKTIAAILCGAAIALAATAEAAEHQVLMLNKGEKGVMIFQPNIIHAEAGDTVRFVPKDKGHNAETIKGMLPSGSGGFKGKMNEEIVVTLQEGGVYGVKCAPHYGMGMVALIVVGDAVNLTEAQSVKHPGKAKAAFAALLGQVVASK